MKNNIKKFFNTVYANLPQVFLLVLITILWVMLFIKLFKDDLSTTVTIISIIVTVISILTSYFNILPNRQESQQSDEQENQQPYQQKKRRIVIFIIKFLYVFIVGFILSIIHSLYTAPDSSISTPPIIQGPSEPVKPLATPDEMDKNDANANNNNLNDIIYPPELYSPAVEEAKDKLNDTDSISAFLNESNGFFDFLKSGILDYNSVHTYAPENIDELNSRMISLSKNIDDMYFDKPNKDYELLCDLYFNHTYPRKYAELTTSGAITKYSEIINTYEDTYKWMIDSFDALTPQVLALYARNYKERAELYYIRNEDGDLDNAKRDYIKAIEAYAHLYRLCAKLQLESPEDAYHSLYWIAMCYHYLGEIQHKENEFAYRLGSFTTADSFFAQIDGENSDASSLFEAYSRYYSAMSCHKTYNAIKKQVSEQLPEEIKSYLHEAINNYNYAKSSKWLKDFERDHAAEAYKVLLDVYQDLYVDL